MRIFTYWTILSIVIAPFSVHAQEGRIGLVPIFSSDETLRDHEQRQLAQLQKKLEQQWGMRVELLLDGWTPYQIKLQSGIEGAQEAMNSLLSPPNATQDSQSLERVQRFRSEVASTLPLSALLADLDVSLARFAFRTGDREKAIDYLVSAVQRHPQRKLFFLSDDWDDPVNEVEATVRERSTKDLTTCQIVWEGNSGEVHVNGFQLSAKGSLKLIAGHTYFIEWRPRNRPRREMAVLCSTDKTVKATAESGWEIESFPSVSVLSHLRQDKQWSTVLLAKSEGQKVKVWNYTDRSGIEKADSAKMEWNPIESVKDITVAATPRQSGTAWSPPAALSDRLETPKGAAWYNKWEFWAIGGGLALGVASAFLLSKGESGPHWKISVE